MDRQPKVHTEKPKKAGRFGRKLLISLCAVLLALALVATVFLTLGGSDLFPLLGAAPDATVVDGPVQGLRVAALPAAGLPGDGLIDNDEGDALSDGGLSSSAAADASASAGLPLQELSSAALTTYYEQVVADARENGINTLIFEGKTGLAVNWRESAFPVLPEIAALDSLFEKVDPLRLFCAAAMGSNIQIWVEVDPYSAAGYNAEMGGKAAALAKGYGAEAFAAFDPADADYNALIVRSLSRLPHKYPIAGVVFTGLEPSPATAAADPAVWGAHFSAMVTEVSAFWQGHKFAATAALLFNGDEQSYITPAAAQSLVESGSVAHLLPILQGGANFNDRFAIWAQLGAKTLSVQLAQKSEASLFLASLSPGFGGVVLGSYSDMLAGGGIAAIGALRSVLQPPDDLQLPSAPEIAQTLGIHYPKQDTATTLETVFVMGTSDPAQPLLLDGQEVPARGQNGAWGVAVTLEMGANAFTFTQGGESAELRITRNAPSSGGSWPEPPTDDTREAAPGQAVRVKDVIASALTNYRDTGTINETYVTGAVAVVRESFSFIRYNANTYRNEWTWAYLLTSGDYIWAGNCEWVDGGPSAFSGITAMQDELGEWLTFEGSGTPAAYLAYEEGTLHVTMYDTSFTLAAGFTSEFVSSASVQTLPDGGTRLSLTFGRDIWGYHIEYTGGVTKLYIKPPPLRGADPTRPLEGVRVMIDPGHGGSEYGALGLMGGAGPNEKDINLTLAQAVAFRMRQLGATVLMTRTDDTFLSLGDRLEAQFIEKPDFFISVHHNSAELDRDRNEAKGVQAYYYHPYPVCPSKDFAQNLLESIAAATGRAGADAGARWGAYYVTRTTVCPSVLFEYGFIINPAEFDDITSPEGIYAAACGTATGLLAMLPVT